MDMVKRYLHSRHRQRVSPCATCLRVPKLWHVLVQIDKLIKTETETA